MAMWSYFDERAHRLGILDTKLAQAAAIFVALVVVKVFPRIMDLSIWWFILLAVACAIKPLITFYRGNIDPGAARNPAHQA